MYHVSHAEAWLMKEYRKRNILTANDLTIESLCTAFSLHVEYHPFQSKSCYEEDFALIFLNKRESRLNQRRDFFHEFSHVLLHVGDQTRLPKSLVELQEYQANWFSLYAAMPYHILYPYIWDKPHEISKTFNVPLSMATRRIRKYKNRRYTITYV